MKLLQTIIDNDTLGSPITSLSFSNDSINLALASKNGYFKIYNIKIGEFTLNNKLNSDYVISILFNKNNTNLTIITKNGDIISYSSSNYKNIIFKLQLGVKINIAKYSPSLNNTIGVACEDGSCKIIELDKKKIIANLMGYNKGPITCISFSPVNKVFISTCGIDGKINFFDISKKSLIKTINTNLNLTSITFNDVGIAVICSDINGNCLLYDLKNSKNDKPNIKLNGNKGKINYIELKKKNSKKNENGNLKSSHLSNDNIIGNVNNNINNNINNNLNNLKNLNEVNEISTNKKNALNDIDENKKPYQSKNDVIKNKNNFTHLNNNIINTNIQNINQKKENTIQIDEQNEIQNALENKIISSLNTKKNQLFINKNPIDNNINNNNNYNIFQNQNLNPSIQNYIDNKIEDEVNKLKMFIHDEINTLHVDLIKQFEIQQNQMMETLRNNSLLNSKMAIEIEKLKRENENLKSQYF